MDRATFDAQEATILSAIATRQTAFHSRSGRYCQVLNGAERDQTSSEGSQIIANVPADVNIHVYNGPQGRGYVVEFIAVEAATTFRRRINVGTETHRTHAWRRDS